jgi:hypothetical protein
LENDARVRVLAWETNAARDRLVAQHTGFAHLGAVHRREFLFDKERGFWVLVDRVVPVGTDGNEGETRRIDIAFHFAPLPVALAGLSARTACETGANLLILPLEGADLEIVEEMGWVSPRYGVRVAAPVTRYTARARLPAEGAFVLWPFEGAANEAEAREQGRRLLAASAG